LTTNCPVCGSSDCIDCVRLPDVPVYCNVLFDRREDALAAPAGDIELVYCRGCGHLHNAAFDPGRVAYSSDYENSLHHSPRFQAYAQALAARLVDDHGLRGRTVVEIACGQGDFLKLLCEAGGSRGIGFDPSYTPGRGGAGNSSAALSFVKDYYGEAHADVAADLICCRHALEHIAQPVAFLRTVRRAIGGRGTPVFFEVPNAQHTIEGLGVWDLIYEHCGYFWEGSLVEAFRRGGFRATRVASEFGAQYLTIDALPADESSHAGAGLAAEGAPSLGQLETAVSRFAEAYRAKVDRWQDVLGALRRDGRRAVLWGAGSKGVSFVNALRPGDTIDCLIDLNPHKHGRFVPCTGQEVRPPESLKARPPDAVIVMNPLYADEIGASLRALGVDADLLVEGAA
jgi:SAM-dependent methyltransferase